MELVDKLNEFTEKQRAVMEAINTMNLYTAEALNWLLVMGHSVEFIEGKKVSFGKGNFEVMSFHAEGFKPEGTLINVLFEKHPELVIPFYNAEMMNRHIELLVAPVHLKARHEEYVLKLNKAAELLMSK